MRFDIQTKNMRQILLPTAVLWIGILFILSFNAVVCLEMEHNSETHESAFASDSAITSHMTVTLSQVVALSTSPLTTTLPASIEPSLTTGIYSSLTPTTGGASTESTTAEAIFSPSSASILKPSTSALPSTDTTATLSNIQISSSALITPSSQDSTLDHLLSATQASISNTVSVAPILSAEPSQTFSFPATPIIFSDNLKQSGSPSLSKATLHTSLTSSFVVPTPSLVHSSARSIFSSNTGPQSTPLLNPTSSFHQTANIYISLTHSLLINALSTTQPSNLDATFSLTKSSTRSLFSSGQHVISTSDTYTAISMDSISSSLHYSYISESLFSSNQSIQSTLVSVTNTADSSHISDLLSVISTTPAIDYYHRSSLSFLLFNEPSSNVLSLVSSIYTHTRTDTSESIPGNTTSKVQKLRLSMKFSGDCEHGSATDLLESEFWFEFLRKLMLSTNITLRHRQIKLDGFECNPFQVVITVDTLEAELFILELNKTITDGQFQVHVLFNHRTLTFTAESIEISKIEETKTRTVLEANQELDAIDIAIIVLASVLFGIFIFICLIVICREFYMRKRAASFNLVDKPIINLKLSDFELIKIPRPKMIYHDRRHLAEAPSPAANGGARPQVKRRAPKPEVDRVRVNSDNLHVRMSDHRDGLIVGVTCMMTATDGDAQINYDTTSGYGKDLSKVNLLKGDYSAESSNGLTNPSYTSTDESLTGSPALVEDDENEQLL